MCLPRLGSATVNKYMFVLFIFFPLKSGPVETGPTGLVAMAMQVFNPSGSKHLSWALTSGTYFV